MHAVNQSMVNTNLDFFFVSERQAVTVCMEMRDNGCGMLQQFSTFQDEIILRNLNVISVFKQPNVCISYIIKL